MKLGRTLSLPIVFGMLASPLLMDCGAIPKGLPGPVGDLAAAGSCPDLTVEALTSLDFTKEFKISAEAGAKLKAGVIASIEIKEFAAKIDADLLTACGGIAKDLGDTAPHKTGEEACKAAAKAMGDVKAKIGANAKIALAVKAPVCRADMGVMADCAAKCDAKVSGPSAKVECEPGKLSGSCDAQCEGTCDVEAGAKCDGECSGKCDAAMKGTCSGKCDGKCDGKDSKGASCAGTCEGKCDASVQGECKGKCGGSCALKAKAKCEGTCGGKCSAEMKAPKCNGEVKPPEMSAECKGQCDAKVSAKAECSPASVGVVITGATDAKAAADFKATIEKNLPIVLKVAIGLATSAPKVAMSGKAAVEGVQASIKDIAMSAGAAQGAMVTGRLTNCFAAPFKGAIEGAASIQANVSVSVDVKASASGSAGGSAGAKK